MSFEQCNDMGISEVLMEKQGETAVGTAELFNLIM